MRVQLVETRESSAKAVSRQGHHLWTRLVSLRALQAGAKLAERMGDPFAAEYYAKAAKRVEASLIEFWVVEDSHKGYWASSIAGDGDVSRAIAKKAEAMGEAIRLPRDQQVMKQSPMGSKPTAGSVTKGLDCGFVLGVLHTADLGGWNDTVETDWTRVEPPDPPNPSDLFDPGHPSVLATLRLYALSLHGLYRVNQGDWTSGWVLGRYAKDVYDGVGQSTANPWCVDCSLLTYTLASRPPLTPLLQVHLHTRLCTRLIPRPPIFPPSRPDPPFTPHHPVLV